MDPVLGTFLGLVVVQICGLVAIYMQSRKNGQKTDEVGAKADGLHADIRTNHGKRPGEYLEAVAELATAMAAQTRALDQHTADDTVRFEDIKTDLTIVKKAVVK